MNPRDWRSVVAPHNIYNRKSRITTKTGERYVAYRVPGVMARGSRRAVGDMKRRYRSQVRAAGRCNAFAEARWRDSIPQAPFIRDRREMHAIAKADKYRGAFR